MSRRLRKPVQLELEALRQRARQAGVDDATAGHRDHADDWPPGDWGHGDYELGQQQVETAREKQRQAVLRQRWRNEDRRPDRRPGQKRLRAAVAMFGPPPRKG